MNEITVLFMAGISSCRKAIQFSFLPPKYKCSLNKCPRLYMEEKK